MELVQGVVVEGGRAKTLVVPGESGWGADDTIAVGVRRVEAESTGARIALEARARITHHPEAVRIAFAETRKKRGPGVVTQAEKLIGGGWSEPCHLRSGKRWAGEYVHLLRGGCEDAEGYATGDEIGSERRVAIDVIRYGWHRSIYGTPGTNQIKANSPDSGNLPGDKAETEMPAIETALPSTYAVHRRGSRKLGAALSGVLSASGGLAPPSGDMECFRKSLRPRRRSTEHRPGLRLVRHAREAGGLMGWAASKMVGH